jgi:hypothetical protein
MQWKRKLKNRQNAKANCIALTVSDKTTYALTPRQLELISKVAEGTSPVTNNLKIREGVLNRSIPSAIGDSGASSNVGTTKDGFQLTGRKSSKIF